MNMAPQLKVSTVGDITHVEFVEKNILDENNIQQISEELVTVVDDVPTPRILISFVNVEHLSSAALGALININNRVKGKDGQLRLCEIDPQIHEVFKITKLDQIFQILPDQDSAPRASTEFAVRPVLSCPSSPAPMRAVDMSSSNSGRSGSASPLDRLSSTDRSSRRSSRTSLASSLRETTISPRPSRFALRSRKPS